MEPLTQHLPTDRSAPRLWFERLAIFSEPGDEHIIRSVPLRRGLNIIWAKEPAAGSTKGSRAAGHGVGKTSLCLLLRLCLGDTSKAVAELREELFGEFAQGGIIGVVHVDGSAYAMCRYFNPHKVGVAAQGSDITAIWSRETDLSDRDFVKQLGDVMMGRVSPRSIPETGQAIEWRHLLAWVSRDQGARFKAFYDWRDGEGNLLQRQRQDPPIVMRSVLGLLDQGETALLNQTAGLEESLKAAKEKVEELLKEPALIQRRIESSLRAQGQLPEDLPIRTDDFFVDSVAGRIDMAGKKAEARLQELQAEQDKADEALADLRADLKRKQAEYAAADLMCQLADKAREGDEQAYSALGAQLLALQQLAGHCKHGNIAFAECQHVQAEINQLKQFSFRDAQHRPNLKLAMEASISRAGAALSRKNDLHRLVTATKDNEKALVASQSKARLATRTAQIEANKWPALLEELSRWDGAAGSTKAQADINAARAHCMEIAQKLSSVQVRLAVAQQNKSDREKALAALIDRLTHQLLPDGAFGSFDPRDEQRPFRISLRGGEAFRVLEVLLGDMACMLDSPRQESALPGFFIHDCPREADMSTGLYENFLSLIDGLQKEQYPDGELPFQYIVTTTTPPPVELQDDAVRLTLDPSSDDGLLFRRRFSGERQKKLE